MTNRLEYLMTNIGNWSALGNFLSSSQSVLTPGTLSGPDQSDNNSNLTPSPHLIQPIPNCGVEYEYRCRW